MDVEMLQKLFRVFIHLIVKDQIDECFFQNTFSQLMLLMTRQSVVIAATGLRV